MTQLSYEQAGQNDLEHLRILSLCYYIMSGITAFFSCLAIFYIILGVFITFAGTSMGGPGAPPSPAFMGWMFIIIGSIGMLIGWTMVILIFMAGRFIKLRRHHTYCVVIAAMCCLQIPIGMVLGVFTFIVLLRPTVKAMFNAKLQSV